MNPLLPIIRDPDHYKDLFKNNSLWDPAIHYLVKQHGLTGEPERASLGSHIVYRVGNSWIKMMAPGFGKDMIYEVEGLKIVQDQLSVATPRVLAEGVLENWPYIILSHLEGESIRSVWPGFSPEQKKNLTSQIARISIEISKCQPSPIIEKRFEWNLFIQQQFQNIEVNQAKKGLPEPWLKNVKNFLGQFDIADFQSAKPQFVHADLTFDHFLVSGKDNPQITGVIDMADCQVGRFEYEVIAPCTFVFKNDPERIQQYLSECQMQHLTPRQLMAWSLMHRFFGMYGFYKSEMDSIPDGDFEILAHLMFF